MPTSTGLQGISLTGRQLRADAGSVERGAGGTRGRLSL